MLNTSFDFQFSTIIQNIENHPSEVLINKIARISSFQKHRKVISELTYTAFSGSKCTISIRLFKIMALVPQCLLLPLYSLKRSRNTQRNNYLANLLYPRSFLMTEANAFPFLFFSTENSTFYATLLQIQTSPFKRFHLDSITKHPLIKRNRLTPP